MSVIASAGHGRLETKFAPIDPAEALRDGRLEGYASLFDVPDANGDEVAPGAFAAALLRRDRRVKLLWQHDASRPIGVWEVLREDARGLFVQGRLLREVQAGAEALALLEAGAIDGLSIGYRAIRTARLSDGRRRLLEVDLWEISLVTFPMLGEARAAAVEPISEDGELEALADTLRAARKIFL